MKLPGRYFLLLTGIVYLIMGLIITNNIIREVFLFGYAWQITLMGAYSMFLMFAGIIGIAFHNKAHKVVLITVIGVLDIILTIPLNLLGRDFIFLVVYAILPISYITGAHINESYMLKMYKNDVKNIFKQND